MSAVVLAAAAGMFWGVVANMIGSFATRSPCLAGLDEAAFKDHPEMFRSVLARSYEAVTTRYRLLNDVERFNAMVVACTYRQPSELHEALLGVARTQLAGLSRSQVSVWAVENRFAEGGGVGRPGRPGGSSDFELRSPKFCSSVGFQNANAMRRLQLLLTRRTCGVRWSIGFVCREQLCEPVYVAERWGGLSDE